MFFKSHGTTQYMVGSNSYPMTDITKVSVSVNIKSTVLQYVNVNSRTPEQMAADIYDDVKLYWTILFINDIIDPFTEWYMSEDHLYKYCIRIYTEEKIYDIRYFNNFKTNEIVGDDMAKYYMQMIADNIQLPEDIEAITNYEYEQLKNDARKVVKIIPKSLITKFVEDFKSTLKG